MKEPDKRTICIFCGNYTFYVDKEKSDSRHSFSCKNCNGYRHYGTSHFSFSFLECNYTDTLHCPFCYSEFYTGYKQYEDFCKNRYTYDKHFCSNPECPSYSISKGNTKFERVIKYDDYPVLLVNSKSTYLINFTNKYSIDYLSKIKVEPSNKIIEFAKIILNKFKI